MLLSFPLLIYLIVSYGSPYVNGLEIPELAYMNVSVDPCENFYEYACGNFKNANPRPEIFPLWDSFIIQQEELYNLMNIILNSNDRSEDPESMKKSRAAYRACVDTEYADKLDYPEVQILNDIGPWPLITHTGEIPKFSWNEVGDIVATYGVPLYFSISANGDLFNASQILVMIGRDPVLNPSITEIPQENCVDFLNYKLRGDEVNPFELFLSNLAVILRNAVGSSKSKDEIKREVPEIVKFMKLVQIGGNDSGNVDNVAQYFTVDELQKWIDTEVGKELNLNILEYLNHVFAKSGVEVTLSTRVMVSSMSSFYGTLNLIKNSSDALLKNFVFSRLFTFTSPDSNKDIRNAYNEFRHQMKDRIFTRSEYCTRFVLGDPNDIALSMAATHEFQKYHFNVQQMNSVIEIIKNLSNVFLDILKESTWLDATTKENAISKAKQMITLLGYPDFVEVGEQVDHYYSNVRICAWDHFGNANRLRALGFALNYALLDKPRNREVWTRSPLIVNALYNSQNNRIILPISMLNEIFYTGKHSAVDYGRIGSVIGHEITHGFDNQGYLYDGEGTLNPWWTPETTAEFRKREKCFVDQYGKYYIPEIDQYVNSSKSVGENIADNGGLREAFQAFQRLHRNSSVDSVEDYTQEQLFFIGYGTMWCAQETNEQLEKLQQSNYPPSRYRVIGSVSNNEEFAKAFNCPLGSNMNPINKCILW